MKDGKKKDGREGRKGKEESEGVKRGKKKKGGRWKRRRWGRKERVDLTYLSEAS